MSDNHWIINGRVVSQEEWTYFLAALRLTKNEITDIVQDGEISKEELDRFLDADNNGKWTVNDLQGFSSSSWQSIRNAYTRYYEDPLPIIVQDMETHDKICRNYEVVGESSRLYCGDIPKFLWDDKDFVLKVVSKSPFVLRWVSNRLQGDRDVGLAEINQLFGSMEFLSEQLRNDRNFVLHAVSMSGYHLKFVSDRLRDDREVVLTAVQKRGRALEFASERLKNDWEIALAAIREDADAMEFIPPSLSRNEKFVAKALEVNPSISGKFGFSFLKKRLNEEDIEFPQRMSYETLVTILHNRENPTLNDGKPVVVLIFPKGDRNGAFQDGHGVIDQIVGTKKFHVLYYEAGSDDSVSVILHRVQQIYPEQVSVLWLAGHGYREGIRFGEPKTLWESFVFGLPWMEEELFLDNGDLSSDDTLGQSISGMMQPKGQIILDSCSTGEGGDVADNFANAIAEHVPSGVTVVSSTAIKMGIGRLSFDEDSIAVEFEGPRSTQRFDGKLSKK